ncbi:MAG: hypothetical protein IKY41_06035 [Clostridia bacterium]|nr:hypothetical protein [Clostridia bacterium]
MATKQHVDAMYYLYGELKSAKISLAHAEKRPGVLESEIKNIKTKIETLEYLIDMAIKHM